VQQRAEIGRANAAEQTAQLHDRFRFADELVGLRRGRAPHLCEQRHHDRRE